jgi:hypothetical protein
MQLLYAVSVLIWLLGLFTDREVSLMHLKIRTRPTRTRMLALVNPSAAAAAAAPPAA